MSYLPMPGLPGSYNPRKRLAAQLSGGTPGLPESDGGYGPPGYSLPDGSQPGLTPDPSAPTFPPTFPMPPRKDGLTILGQTMSPQVRDPFDPPEPTPDPVTPLPAPGPAPTTPDPAQGPGLGSGGYDKWLESHTGSYEDYLKSLEDAKTGPKAPTPGGGSHVQLGGGWDQYATDPKSFEYGLKAAFAAGYKGEDAIHWMNENGWAGAQNSAGGGIQYYPDRDEYGLPGGYYASPGAGTGMDLIKRVSNGTYGGMTPVGQRAWPTAPAPIPSPDVPAVPDVPPPGAPPATLDSLPFDSTLGGQLNKFGGVPDPQDPQEIQRQALKKALAAMASR